VSEFRPPIGFEDALRPPVDVRRARITPATIGRPAAGEGAIARARLMGVARRAPEVMVKITGRTRDGGHLKRHLDYISRNGKLVLEGPDGERLAGRDAVRTLAQDWSAEVTAEPGRRRDSPMSLSVVLSMPAGTDALKVQDGARAFASATFGDRYPYVFVLHTDDHHPHVHLTVRMLGRDGDRLNPRKADLQAWREAFAQALRERGVEAEATPRRARGVVKKAERIEVRKMRGRFENGAGGLPNVLAAAYRDAQLTGGAEPWREPILERQRNIRRALVAEALRLGRSDRSEDRTDAVIIERFVRDLPTPETRRDEIVRRVEAARGLEISPGLPDRPRRR